MRQDRLLEIGHTICERMGSLGFKSFNADDVRRQFMNDEKLHEIITALLSESKMRIYDCGHAISATLRRVVKATEGMRTRLVDLGRVHDDGTPNKGRPVRFAFVTDETKPEPEPARPTDPTTATDADRIIAAIERLGDRIEAAIRFR